MATREQITTALLTEHLRYTPLTLLDDIINTVNELVYQAVNNIETALLNVPPAHLGFVAPPSRAGSSGSAAPAQPAEEAEEALAAAARTEIESGIVKLESLLNATVDKDFDKLEIYTLRNLLTVSNAKDDEGLEDWIVLEHYKKLQFASPQSRLQTQDQGQEQPTPESIRQLDSKLSETEKLHSLLLAENARNEALLSQLRPLLSSAPAAALKQEDTQPGAESHQTGSFSFLTAAPSAQALGLNSNVRTGVMPQNTRFTYSQLSSLREVVQRLRPHLKKLASGLPADLTTTRSEEERVAYIEAQAKKAMERAGVEGTVSLGDDGGKKVGREEVMALEGVVGALSGNRASAAKRSSDEDTDRMEE